MNLNVSHNVNAGPLRWSAMQSDRIIHVKMRATVICVLKCTVNVPRNRNRIAVHISINSMMRPLCFASSYRCVHANGRAKLLSLSKLAPTLAQSFTPTLAQSFAQTPTAIENRLCFASFTQTLAASIGVRV